MRESIGGSWLFQIVIVLILLFTAYLCLSINYTAAYKVSDSIVNQIQVDKGVKVENIKNVLAEVKYTSQGKCNVADGDESWTPMSFSGPISNEYSDSANYCLKKVVVRKPSSEHPGIYYYRIKVFYKLDVPIISRFNFNVQSGTANVFNASDDITIKLVGDGA